MRKYVFFIRAFLILLSTGLIFSACSDDKDDNGDNNIIPPDKLVNILVVNEGNYNNSNSTISAIMSDGTVDADYYYTVNSRRIGDTGQAIFTLDGNFYVTVSGSHIIEVLNGEDFKREKVISHNSYKPYIICVINNLDKLAAVSDLNGYIHLLNYEDNEIVYSMAVGAPVYEMAVVSGELFFATSEWNDDEFNFDCQLSYVELDNFNTIKKLSGVEPLDRTRLIVDRDRYIWTYNADGLVVINPRDLSIDRTLKFADMEGDYSPSYYSARIAVNSTGDKIYFNLERDGKFHIAEISYAAYNYDDAYVFECDGLSNFYNMEYSPDNTLYVCDTDYISNGKVIQYSLQGQKLKTYTVGVNPYFLYFVNRK